MLNFNCSFQETFQKVKRKIVVILLLPDQDASSSTHCNRKNAKRETLAKKIGTSQLLNRVLLSACKGIPNGTDYFTFTGAMFMPLGKHPLKILTITELDQN